MKKSLVCLVIFLLVFSSMALAGPFLVCDPQEGVTHYKISTGDVKQVVAAEADGSLKYDLSQIDPGALSRELRAGSTYDLDGEPSIVFEWSDPLPFVLKKPLVQLPIGLSLKR